MTRIYNALLDSTTIEWTDDPHDPMDRLRWQHAQQRQGLPVLVAVEQGEVVGWASYGPFRDVDRWPGYRYTVEHSIHLAQRAWGRGAGRALMGHLIERAIASGLHVMVAGIDADNEASIRFHDRLGFVEVGRMKEIGFGHGRWLDLVLMQRTLVSPVDHVG